MAIISPSVLASDFSRLGEEAAAVEKAGAQWLHLDVMDGLFVPNISFGAPVIKAIRPLTKLFFDVHLMIENPLRYIEDFAKAGADIITFHLESKSDAAETIDKIVSCGRKAAVSIKPGTPAEAVFPLLDKVSMVLVMTVEPGFGGQSFIEDMMPKVRAIRDEITRRNLSVYVQVDGGISGKTIRTAADAGADVFVAGSAIFGKPDYAQAVAALNDALK